MSTIKMVAARAGVSTATVSRALSNPDIVVPETRAKVQAAIEELGYAPNFAAKSLRMLRTSKIVMMVPDVSNPFFSEVLRRAEDMAEQAGYSVLLGDTRDDANREAQFADMLQRKEVDGVIFLGHRMPVTLVNAVKDKGPRAPIVNSCDFSPAFGVSGVHIDNVRAAQEAMALLQSMGHRRIGIITGPVESNITSDRLTGVKRAAETPGRETELLIRHADYTIEAGQRETERLLALPARPTAIFCFSDEMAVGALAACRAYDLECPRDLSIVGFDDIRYARYLDPPLTTVRQPMELIGKTAVRLLLAIIDGTATETRVVTLDHELVVRGSTGPAPVLR
ncbi:LacI family DNA-binding transcriptional regulator [Rhizorhabdus wittichii]|uniref:LacI family DNA-binding transcriptional regulator n=1 Tax=Rhizorhabdus wittichii TaxID=160791 RepID=A0A975D3E4_9SPHN|nr:LacI family DNA-binding transcriptional regulator [Rhizorhabdus wittichii]QTH21551.1 LacI family DNA-binding transcriptional regulator [Rhizorhabdus wittichii]